MWRGDAPAVAQIDRHVPVNVNVGDSFYVECNGKRITVTATVATAESVVALLVEAITASDIPEFQEVTASADGTALLLTSNEAGVPFIITSGASNGSGFSVSVATATAGVVGTNFKQSFKVPLTAAGTFKIVIGDQVTSGIAAGASAGTVQTAIQGLSTVGSGNATVAKTSDSNDDTYEVTFGGALAGIRVATMIVRLYSTKPIIRTTQAGASSGTPQNEIQTIDIGTSILGSSYTMELTLGAETTPPTVYGDVTATALQTQLQNFTGVETVTVTLSGTVYTIEFTGVDGSANQSQLVASTTDAALFVLAVTTTDGIASASEVQTVTLVGQPTGGTFTLTFEAQTTSTIAYNASAGTVQTALEALASIGSGNATVSGAAGGPWTVTFAGAEANTDQLLITGSGASLTGGSGQSVTSSNDVASSGPNHWDCVSNWVPVGIPVTGDTVIFEDNGADCLYGLDQSSVTLAKLTVSMAWMNRKLGLPHVNSNGYREYRTRQLTCGITVAEIGTQSGSGPSRVYLNTGSIQTAITVFNSGSSVDSLPAVIWIGANASNTITILGGDFGASPFSDTSCSFESLIMHGGSAKIWNANISQELITNGNPFRSFNTLHGGSLLEI